MNRFARFFTFTLFISLPFLAANAQVNKNETAIPPQKPETQAATAQDDKPHQFDIIFKVKEEKYDTTNVNQVVRAFMARLNSSGLIASKDYNIYVGHDSIQVRFLDNTRSYQDWKSLLFRQGLIQLHITNDSLYGLKVDSTHVPKGYVVLPEIDLKTTHYVSNQVLNGNLVSLSSTIEKFDEPTLTGTIMPRDTQYQSFEFRKGMRIAVVVDGVIYSTAVVTVDSAAINTFPLLTQYPVALTFIMDRVIRFPLLAPVEILGIQAIKEDAGKK